MKKLVSNTFSETQRGEACMKGEREVKRLAKLMQKYGGEIFTKRGETFPEREERNLYKEGKDIYCIN